MNKIDAQSGSASCPSPTRQYTPNHLPGTQARIGLIVLASDPSSEPEWRDMVRGHDIAIHVSRIVYDSNCTPESLRAMGGDMTRAAGLLAPNLSLDTVAYSCTSGTVAIGHQKVVDNIQVSCPGLPVATPISGAAGALKHFGASRVAVVTPYTDTVNATIQSYLENEGLEITGMTGFSLTRDEDMACVPVDALLEAARESITAETEAVFFSCTALIIAKDIPWLEEQLGLPVVTSNQAMLWESLKSVGYDKPLSGFGRLMESLG
jgi:maleate isomerase